jgi:hypothetical protein
LRLNPYPLPELTETPNKIENVFGLAEGGLILNRTFFRCVLAFNVNESANDWQSAYTL